MSKLIIIAGIKRSGSTWLYNAVRLSLLHAGKSVYLAGDGTNYDEACRDDYQLMKRHPYERLWADRSDYVFTSDRADDEIRDSLKRAFGSELNAHRLGRFRKWLDQWIHWRAHVLHADYDRILNDKPWIVQSISDVFGLGFTVGDVQDVLRALEDVKPPTDSNYDPVTLYFKNHITSAL